MLDVRSRWLLVVALPEEAFHQNHPRDPLEVQNKVQPELEDINRALKSWGMFTLCFMAVVSVVLGLCLGVLVSPDLRRLSNLVRELGALDFNHKSPEFSQLLSGQRAFISDVSDLQDAFCRLNSGVQAFARFVPEAVVRNILRGSLSARRLHVSQREVTAMFSNIRGFTAMSESLSQTDLVLVMTRYLTFMTHVVESFDGVVAEILGDGMLSFWNTPDDVEDHPTRACMAALAMQRELMAVNVEFSELGLPTLVVCVGLHTGAVLSGNLGSKSKMKFGCMGDAVNLASRLQGLCKLYNAEIICSGATHAEIMPNAGLVSRKLDLVQVKGKSEPTWIYELIGADGTRPCGQPISPQDQSFIDRYEAALEAYQSANFASAYALAEASLRERPNDSAALHLLQRTSTYLGPEGQPHGLSEAELRAWTGAVVMTNK